MTEVGLSALADGRYDGELLAAGIGELVSGWSLSTDRRRGAVLGTQALSMSSTVWRAARCSSACRVRA
jgi:hypothetical protein